MNNKVSKWMKATALVSTAVLFLQVPTALANTLSDLKEQQRQTEQKANQINSSIQQKSSQINGIQSKQETLLAQIQLLNDKITNTNTNISIVAQNIVVVTKEIEELQVSIEKLIKKIEERDVLLRDRIRAVQENGNISYLDVLLGANSFVDFIDRFSAVSTLIEADRQILRDQKNDKESLEEQKYLVEEKRKKLEVDKAELERLKTSLDSQKVQKNKLIDELEAEQQKLSSEKALLEEEYSEAVQISEALQRKIMAEQNRIAEIARQQEALRNQQNGGSLPEVTDGTWMKPTNGTFTSGYGWRNIGSGSEFHYGIDLANSVGTPIVAAADGVVSYAAPLSTYGNVVMVTHSINGEIYTTLYAHLSGFNASVGTVVSKGQQIAEMGNTGRSFGSHLHFEIHKGKWVNQKTGVLNPLRFINL